MKKAFTLIELLVVIAIIALLMSIIVSSLQMAKKKASVAVCLANVKNVGLAWYGYPLHGFMLQQVDNNTNDSPVVDAGEDKRIYLVNGSSQVEIDATVTDDDPSGLEELTIKWTQLSGPESVVFLPNANTWKT